MLKLNLLGELKKKQEKATNTGYTFMPAKLTHGKFAASQRTGEFAGTSSIAYRCTPSRKTTTKRAIFSRNRDTENSTIGK